MTNIDWESLRDTTTIPWAQFTTEDFVQFYWRVATPILEEEGHDPESPPSAETMREYGFGRYIQAIRRHYDYTFKQFLAEEVGVVEEECPHEYNWPIDDAETKEWLDKFVRDLRDRDSTKQKESTITRIASNIYVFLHEWQAVHGSTEIIRTLKTADEDEMYSLVLAVYDRLNKRDISVNTKTRYVTDHDFWFEFLTHPKHPLDYNPISGVEKRFQWTRSEVEVLERSALSPAQVKTLWKHANTLEERMILIAACAWGLRAGEIAALHIDQLILNPEPEHDFDHPVINFDRRKQGPSSVNIVFGRNIVEERIEQLEEEFENEWNGYLFPSADHRTEHLQSSTMLKDRFQPIAERADVTVDGEKPFLKQARRFWYQRYWTGQQRYHELVSLAAEEQGSTDTEVVKTNYLGDLSRLEFSRLWVRQELEDAFEDEDITKEPIYVDDSLVTIREAMSDILTLVTNGIEQAKSTGETVLEDENGAHRMRGPIAVLRSHW